MSIENRIKELKEKLALGYEWYDENGVYYTNEEKVRLQTISYKENEVSDCTLEEWITEDSFFKSVEHELNRLECQL